MSTLRPLKRSTVVVMLLSITATQLVGSRPIPEYENPDDWDESMLDDFSINLAIDFPRIYGVPNDEVGANITREAKLSDKPLSHPEELGTYLEGDMLVMKEQRTVLTHASHWLGGVVPYEFARNVDEESIERIMEAFAAFHRHTCIRFQPHNGEPDYVEIASNQQGCFASLGKVHGRSVVNLQKECTTQLGTMLHELMHVLGFVHEQNRWDRNKYVKVLHQNILPEKMDDFHEYTAKELNGYNIKYDYKSVMHYSWNAFSKNGRPTIISRDRKFSTNHLGQRCYFSSLDLKKLNLVYNCPQAQDSTEEPDTPINTEPQKGTEEPDTPINPEDSTLEPDALINTEPQNSTVEPDILINTKKNTSEPEIKINSEDNSQDNTQDNTRKCEILNVSEENTSERKAPTKAKENATEPAIQLTVKETTKKPEIRISAKENATDPAIQLSVKENATKPEIRVSTKTSPTTKDNTTEPQSLVSTKTSPTTKDNTTEPQSLVSTKTSPTTKDNTTEPQSLVSTKTSPTKKDNTTEPQNLVSTKTSPTTKDNRTEPQSLVSTKTSPKTQDNTTMSIFQVNATVVSSLP